MLVIKDLYKDYNVKGRTFNALKKVNLMLPNKGFISLYGENGCGKTTLLNAISTYNLNYRGFINYNNLDTKTNKEFIRREIVSFLFQEDIFIEKLSISENLILFSEDENKEEVLEKLKEYSILEKKDNFPSTISGGQKQRASFIRAELKKSKILLVDEPTSSLDEEMETVIFEKLRVIAKDKLVILVSHNLGLIKKYSDKVIYMDNAVIKKVVDINRTTPFIYDGNIVTVSCLETDLSLIDKDFINKTLERGEEVILKKSSLVKQEKVELDYSKEDVDLTFKSKAMSKGLFKTIFFRNSRLFSTYFSFSVLSILVLLLTSIIFTFISFDTSSFIYRSLEENTGTYVNFISEGDVFNNETKKHFRRADLDYLDENYNSRVDVLLDYPRVGQLDITTKGIFINEIFGVSYSLKDNMDIILGEFPTSSIEYLVTDYLADSYMSSSNKYVSYKDFLTKGILLQNEHFNICGVLNTDYEKYSDDYNKSDFISSNKEQDYINDMQNKYKRL